MTLQSEQSFCTIDCISSAFTIEVASITLIFLSFKDTKAIFSLPLFVLPKTTCIGFSAVEFSIVSIVRISVCLITRFFVLSKSVSRSEEHTSELQSRFDIVCRLLLEKKKGREHVDL